MSLPVLKSAIYTMVIPSSKEEIKFRPFTVKEENALLIAREADDATVQLNTMVEVLKTCTFDKVDVGRLATFDIEYMFINIRAKSVGEVVDINMKCKNSNAEGVKCGGIVPFSINLTDIDVVFDDNHSNTVMVEDQIGITFKYPNIESFNRTKDTVEKNPIQAIVVLVESIFDKDGTYEASSYSDEDLLTFIESIPSKPFKEIQDKFVNSMPSLKVSLPYKCTKCGKEGVHEFKGLQDFFV